MKKNKGIFLVVIFLLAALIAFMASIKGKIPENIFCFLDIGTYKIPPNSVEVNSSYAYGQTFLWNFDNLFMMSIFVPAQNLKDKGELSFHLKKNKDDDNDLVTLKWRFNQIRFLKNDFYIIPPDREITKKGFHFHFRFPPVKDSKNREFYFYFESPNTKAGDGIMLGVWDNIGYYEALKKGQMFVNQNSAKGFLAFRTYHTWQGDFKQIVKVVTARLLKDRAFLMFYLSFIGTIFIGVIVLLLIPN